MKKLTELGALISRSRESSRLTQKDLALLAGISDATLRAIEWGKPGVAIQNWVKIADVLGFELQLTVKNRSDEKGKSME